MLRGKRKIAAAVKVLEQLGLPRAQQNQRSALTLLALLDLRSATPWDRAGSPSLGITPMMQFFAQNYGVEYAPNTRETVRRQTIHQFVQAGLVLDNPDGARPVNSPDYVYRIEPSTLELLRTYGSERWDENLAAYLASRETLQRKYAHEREMEHVPVTMATGERLELSSGSHSVLIKEVVEKFCGYYTPGGEILYVGDTGDKYIVWEANRLASLGVVTNSHGKMPDLVVWYRRKRWLVLVEAVTSHGPVNAKRHQELKELFLGAKAPLVFVTAFLNRKTMSKYLADISWETEVWVAQSPTHLIHFNGDRFLGPYE